MLAIIGGSGLYHLDGLVGPKSIPCPHPSANRQALSPRVNTKITRYCFWPGMVKGTNSCPTK